MARLGWFFLDKNPVWRDLYWKNESQQPTTDNRKWARSAIFLSKNFEAGKSHQDGSSGLPLSFRSTIYLDVFGWHSRHFSAAAVLNAVDCAHHWENSDARRFGRKKRWGKEFLWIFCQGLFSSLGVPKHVKTRFRGAIGKDFLWAFKIFVDCFLKQGCISWMTVSFSLNLIFWEVSQEKTWKTPSLYV